MMNLNSTKSIEEVEKMTTEAIKNFSGEVTNFTSNTIAFVKKNPFITAAVLLTTGLIIAKVINDRSVRSSEDSPDDTHKESIRITH